MTFLALQLDALAAGHLAVAIRTHRETLARQAIPEPVGLAELQALAVGVAKNQDASVAINVPAVVDAGSDDREYLSRDDVAGLAQVSLPTVDRWIRSGLLPSAKLGRLRRVERVELVRFLSSRADQ